MGLEHTEADIHDILTVYQGFDQAEAITRCDRVQWFVDAGHACRTVIFRDEGLAEV